MARFRVVEREGMRGEQRFAVVDSESDDLPVATFERREDAEAHVEKLEKGPMDLDEQEEWQEEDWGDWESWD